MNKLKAIIFDADGTLLDSFELIYSAYKYVALEHHLQAPTANEVRNELGRPLPDIFATFYPEQNISELLETNSRYVAANTMKSKAFDGVEELLSSLKDRGYVLAILTSGGPKIVNILEHHGIDKYFASIVHHERIKHPKPHPEGFFLAAKECGVLPEEAVMVGDTDVDVETAKNANAFSSIAITHGYHSVVRLKESEPDYMVDSLHEIIDLL